MSEKLERLRATLANLHAELAAADEDDPEVRALLTATLAELQAAVEQHGAALPQSLPREERTSILGRLQDAVQHYQDSHPAMAATIGSVIDVLGRMGI
jgi:hypothetical protein